MGADGPYWRWFRPRHLHRWGTNVFSECDPIEFADTISWGISDWHWISYVDAVKDSNAVTIGLSYDLWNAIILADSVIIAFASRAE
jgi:hypothetical protein